MVAAEEEMVVEAEAEGELVFNVENSASFFQITPE